MYPDKLNETQKIRKIFGTGVCLAYSKSTNFWFFLPVDIFWWTRNQQANYLVNYFMVSNKLLSISSENCKFCNFLSCAVNIKSFKNVIFHWFLVLFVSGQFLWRLKSGSGYFKNLPFLNNIPDGLLGNQVIKLFLRTSFEF